MLLKNNSAHGSPLRYLGGSANAGLLNNGSTRGASLSYRVAFGATASYPVGYGLNNAVIGPVTNGGSIAARPWDAQGVLTGALRGIGALAGDSPGISGCAAVAMGYAPLSGAGAGIATLVCGPLAWPGQLAGAIRIGMSPTSEDLATALLDEQYLSGGWTVREALDLIAARMAAVADGPAVAIPAPPGTTMSVAWCFCYDEHGQPESGVTIQIKLATPSGSGVAYDRAPLEAASNSQGLAQLIVPRGAGLRFLARRGTSGAWTPVSGVNADTLPIPALLGTP